MAMGPVTPGGDGATRPVRLVNPEMAAAASEFKALRHEPAGAVVMRLLDLILNQCRIENDTAEPNVVLRNQGRIDVLLRLKRTMDRE